jgi:hypothetical protein
VAGASAEGEANHWPAFVDVLTTVIMVVTFMLVIMSAAIMVLSKRVIAEIREQAKVEAQADASGGPTMQELKAQLAAAQQQIAQLKNDSDRINSPKDAAAGTSIAALGSVLKQDQSVPGDERLTIRTRQTPEEDRVAVAALERPKQVDGVAVQSADTLLRIDFEAKAVQFTDEGSKQIQDFLTSTPYRDKAVFEIWSFAPQTASVSEAQRMAFYRAVLTRNQLIQAGIPPGRINTQVRVVDPTTESHNVRVVIKP